MKIENLKKHIIRELSREGHSSKVYSDPLNLLVKGTDAGIYRLIPKLIVQADNETDVIAAINVCRKEGLPLTFKAGGTSLSGQTVTDSVLLEAGPEYTHYSVVDNGKRITLQPGITGGRANAILSRYSKKIGPSPASISSAKIGGIIGNNASGANYGISTNSYNTLERLRLVMYDGSILDSGDQDSRSRFAETHPGLLSELLSLSEKVRIYPEYFSRIRRKYELKNTTGYGLNSLIDFEDPVDILWHLVIGSEGTLAFVSEATYSTIDSFPKNAAALILLPDITEACKAIAPLLHCKVTAAELMDSNALIAVRNIPGIPEIIRNPGPDTVALLIDSSAVDDEILMHQTEEIRRALDGIRTLSPPEFIVNKTDYNRIWKVRKGLFTSAAATRPRGTSCLIEDVAFRPEVLADALVALRSLISRYGYKGSVMWGHLLDGNVHFVIMPDFRSPSEVDKYKRFMEDFVRLTVKEFDGSLKAEHGTGRNMAPFVKEEWGSGLYDVMKNIKKAFDPENILNPGVLINEDPQVHLKNLKPVPVVDESIDKCIECGFCESDCPSKDLTFTPRQRIVAYRELFRQNTQSGFKSLESEVRKSFAYNVDKTCATDGLCAIACPVEINTGKLVKEYRMKRKGKFSRSVAGLIANHIDITSLFMRGILNLLAAIHKLTGARFMASASRLLHTISAGRIPLWNRYMPSGTVRLKTNRHTDEQGNSVVYFPSCINRTFGTDAGYEDHEPAVAQKTIDLLQKSGYSVIIPENHENFCCGMAFDSKGFAETGLMKARELESALLKASDGGRIPVLCEMSPCLLRMKETFTPDLKLYEPVEFTLKYLAPRLNFTKLERTVTVHSTCSSTKMGLTEDLISLAKMCCSEVIVPDEIGCCGWAGDRGFSVPELNASALASLKSNIPPGIKHGYSTSRTCEIGLSLHSGITYKSILYLVDECTQR